MFYPHSTPTPPPLLFSGCVRWSRKALFFKWLIYDDIWSSLKIKEQYKEKSHWCFDWHWIDATDQCGDDGNSYDVVELYMHMTYSPLRSSSMLRNSFELCLPFVRFICRKLTLLFLAHNVCFCKVILPCLLQLVQRNDF